MLVNNPTLKDIQNEIKLKIDNVPNDGNRYVRKYDGWYEESNKIKADKPTDTSYLDILQITNTSTEIAPNNNRVATIRIYNKENENQMLLAVHDKSNSPPNGIALHRDSTSTWVTMPTITSGTWKGNLISVDYGGTGTATASVNKVFAGPTSGSAAAPSFRSLDATDIPELNASKITAGTLAVARGGTNASTANVNVVFAGPSSGSAAAPSFRKLVAADIPELNASKITTGTLAVAHGGTNAATASVNRVFAGPSSGDAAAPSFRKLVAADIPELNASKITTGTLTVAHGGTNTATTDANKVFAGPSSGSAAAPSFRKLTATDIPELNASKITTGTLPIGKGGTNATNASDARTNLGFSLTRDGKSPAAQNIQHNTNTNVCEFTLSAGLYVVICSATFANNSTGGRRYLFLADSSNNGLGGTFQVQTPPANGGTTMINCTGILSISASNTYRLMAYQNSGGDLEVTPRVVYLKIL